MSDKGREKKTGELDLTFFQSIGFTKRSCIKCGSYYWSGDPERKTCGDPPCDSYSFIDNSPVARKYSLREMREEFLSFFRENHSIIDPYPVVPRWRDDVLLVNASIYDFQPHVTSGRVKPPGNPLAMSQPSVRMNDTDLVGETGRHLTSFEMLCHDAFNYPDHYVYWKEETVEYCYRFLTSRLKIQGELITFKEKPWSGGGNGGNAFEVFVRGLEVATLVFMDLREDPRGEYEIDGKLYSRMDIRIVDTGYGLERLTWLSQGTPTVYQAVMPDIVKMILDHSRSEKLDNRILSIMSTVAVESEPFSRRRMIDRTLEILERSGISDGKERLEKMFEFSRSAFVLADHTKTLMVLFSDHVIPSNVKVGYLARLLIRRSMRAIQELDLDISLMDLILEQWKPVREIFPNFSEKFAREALSSESAKFQELERRSRQIVIRTYEKSGKFNADDLVTLYDSYGIVPEEVVSVLKEEKGIQLEIPEDFNAMVVRRHDVSPQTEITKEAFPDIFTRPLYYDDPTMKEFNAIVLFSKGNDVITNQTAFYPEGGGQPYDTGYFLYHGKEVRVNAVHRFHNAVVHRLESPIPERSRIIGRIDYERRHRLMVHHSATHLLLGVLREILGDHVWQSGVQKGTEHSRLDITHFRKLSPDEIERVEARCLQYITENRAITVRNIEWNRALKKYGFRLFEGGVPEGKEIRVVEIDGVDAEGCGGTHLKSTGEIGFLKIMRVETIQEGIQRITFSAGIAALDYVQGLYRRSAAIESLLSVKSEDTFEATKRLFEENLALKKDLEKRLKDQVESIISSGKKLKRNGQDITVLSDPGDPEVLKLLVSAVFSRRMGSVIIPVSHAQEIRIISAGNADVSDLAKTVATKLRGNMSGSGKHIVVSGFSEPVTETLISEILDASNA